jgi:hypothetical protein
MSKKRRDEKRDELKQYEDITVANMNIEGMPWYVKKPEDLRSSGASAANSGKAADSGLSQVTDKEILTPKETRQLIINSVLAALFIGGVFLFAIFLFLLFCVYVWF